MIHAWETLTHQEFEKLSGKPTWVLLPIGSIEQHGPHMPVGTDSIIVTKAVQNLKGRIPSDTQFIVLPTLYYGKSVEHLAFSGTISLSAHTFLSVIKDIVTSLSVQGFDHIIIVNGHGGNIGMIDGYLQDLRQENQVQIFSVHVPRLISLIENKEVQFPQSMHAGIAETSLLKHWTPELVKTDHIPQEKTNSKGLDFLASLAGKADWGWATEEVSEPGYIGEPSLASETKGKEFAERLAQLFVDTLERIIKCPF